MCVTLIKRLCNQFIIFCQVYVCTVCVLAPVFSTHANSLQQCVCLLFLFSYCFIFFFLLPYLCSGGALGPLHRLQIFFLICFFSFLPAEFSGVSSCGAAIPGACFISHGFNHLFSRRPCRFPRPTFAPGRPPPPDPPPPTWTGPLHWGDRESEVGAEGHEETQGVRI